MIRNVLCVLAASLACLQAAPQLSVETLGVLKKEGFNHSVYGVGLDLGAKFNKWVSGHVQAVSYENQDQWGGSTIDEGALLVKANLFAPEKSRLSLYALGGGDYSFERGDFGFGVGAGGAVRLLGTKHFNLSLDANSRVRAWFNTDKDWISQVGLKFSF
jgi:hypothetical protein